MLRIDDISLVTFCGLDFERLLVLDDSLRGDDNACDYCIYDAGVEYGDKEELLSCSDVHSCGGPDHYYLLRSCKNLKR